MTHGKNLYGSEFYADQQDGSLRSAEVVVPLLLRSLAPSSVVDIGCGVGTWLSVFHAAGVADITGMDGEYVDRSMLKIPAENFRGTDIRDSIPTGRRFDVALCLEVAEHIPAAAGDKLVQRLTEIAPVVVFSAAIPGQAGTDHINEQWQDYWRERFARHGFRAFDVIRPKVWKDDRVDFWYRQNIICYVQEGHPVDPAWRAVVADASLDIVHPALFQQTREQADMYLSRAVSILPRLAVNAIRRRMPGYRARSGTT